MPCSQVEEAEEVLGHMLRGKVHPEVAIFNTLIAGYGRRGEVRKAFKLFNTVSVHVAASALGLYIVVKH